MSTNITPSSLAIGAMLILGTGTGFGRECGGVAFSNQVKVDGANLMLNGLGMRTLMSLNVNVYVAALYVTKPSDDANTTLAAATPSELILHFVHDVTARAMTDVWDEGFAHNARGQLPILKDRIATLNGWMTPMKVGQRMSFSFKPGTGVTVTVNGTLKGTIKGDDFAKALLSTWLGTNPPNPELKAGLLGGACG